VVGRSRIRDGIAIPFVPGIGLCVASEAAPRRHALPFGVSALARVALGVALLTGCCGPAGSNSNRRIACCAGPI
jgi:hypothetical protein